MQCRRASRVFADQNGPSNFLLHHGFLQPRQQRNKLLQIFLVLVFPSLHPLCRVFALDEQDLARTGLVAPSVEMLRAAEPELVVPGAEALVVIAGLLDLSLELEDLWAWDEVALLQHLERRVVRELWSLHQIAA